MIISKHPGTKIDIQVDGTQVEQVDGYTFLSTQVTDDGRNETWIKFRIGLAKAAFCSMANLLTSRHCHSS